MRIVTFSRLFRFLYVTMRYILTTLALILISFQGNAQADFRITAEIEEAYTSIINLNFTAARRQIQMIKLSDPRNMMVYHIENYIDFFTVFITEEKEVYDRLEKNKNMRLEHVRKGDPDSPYFKFTQAEILLQWTLARSKFYSGSKIPDFTLINDLNQAYRLLEKNDREFPEFFENKKSLSVIHALAEYVPGFVKKVFKVKGSLELGLAEIETLILETEQHHSMFQKEARAIHAYMLLHLFNRPQQAWESLQKSQLLPEESPLACFLLVSIAHKIGYNDLALEYLKKRPTGIDYFPFYYLDYLEGKSLLYSLEADADDHILNFVQNFKGRHFIKDAYQKLAWYELVINKNLPAYKSYMAKVESEGMEFLEDDLQALQEAKSHQNPHPILLEARLLFDGGYYEKAYQYMIMNGAYFQGETFHNIEYRYRLGRITQAIGNMDEAISHYQKCIALDTKNKSFFAANSALQTALLYEEQGLYQKAKTFFNICKSIKSPTYKDQLHSKANAGLDRLEQKL